MINWLIFSLTTLLTLHSLLDFFSMFYSWQDIDRTKLRKSPRKFKLPNLTFSLLLPVRNESKVIKDTLVSMSKISYPKSLFEVIILCRSDDKLTLDAIKKTLTYLKTKNIKLQIVGTRADNKPKSLNIGLSKSKKQIIGIFDAEDEPHKDILNIINTLIISTNSDIIQSGVQLMNYQSKWFSLFNVLEYYFWFKSSMPFFAQVGVVPLGGNTVFFKRNLLNKNNGWNENMLTEDADIGIRMSVKDARILVVYDEKHVTKEETPSSVSEFIKQRTRWNQGFLQIFLKFDWVKIKGAKRKILCAYVLIVPILQTFWVIYFPLMIVVYLTITIPEKLIFLTTIPFIILASQLYFYNFAAYDFTKDYNFKYSPKIIWKVLTTYYPYQVMLSFSSIRAIYRLIKNQNTWEKTTHQNTHRQTQSIV